MRSYLKTRKHGRGSCGSDGMKVGTDAEWRSVWRHSGAQNVFSSDFFCFLLMCTRIVVHCVCFCAFLGGCSCSRARTGGRFSTCELVMLPSSGCPSGLQPTFWEIFCARSVIQDWLSGMPPSTGLYGYAQSHKWDSLPFTVPSVSHPSPSTTKETLGGEWRKKSISQAVDVVSRVWRREGVVESRTSILGPRLHALKQ